MHIYINNDKRNAGNMRINKSCKAHKSNCKVDNLNNTYLAFANNFRDIIRYWFSFASKLLPINVIFKSGKSTFSSVRGFNEV